MLNSGKQIKDLKTSLDELRSLLGIDNKSKRVADLRKLMLASSFGKTEKEQ